MHLSNDDSTLRILLAALKLAEAGSELDLEKVAFESQVPMHSAKSVLSSILNLKQLEDSAAPDLRLRLAMEIARLGYPEKAAKALTWQEFEGFAEDCLLESRFQTEKNVRVQGEGRAWQIDVLGIRGKLILAIDCKHWNTPAYISRFRLAADHQRQATVHLLRTIHNKKISGPEEPSALPIILTLREPPTRFSWDTTFVSIEKLPRFLSDVTPYDEDLPFITSTSTVVQNPMNQSS